MEVRYVPLRADNTFDIIPSGFSGFDDEIGFNLKEYMRIWEPFNGLILS